MKRKIDPKKKTKKATCGMCFGTKEVAYISMPPGQRVYPCPECAGGEVPTKVKNLLRKALVP